MNRPRSADISEDAVLTFMSGSITGAVSCVNLTADDDEFLEINETYQLSLEAMEAGIVVDVGSTMDITILDNDGKTQAGQSGFYYLTRLGSSWADTERLHVVDFRSV